jgi:CHAD domain-containing protein
VAPLTATLAASAAVGLGLTLARAGRERLAARQRERARELGLLPGERLDFALKRMAGEQLDLAIEELSQSNGAAPSEKAVHETRKALKRLRAMLRLLESALGEEAVALETAVLREVAAALSGARDAEVMLGTLDALVERHPRKLDRKGVRRLRGFLVLERENTRRSSVGDPVRVALAIADLSACKLRVRVWELPAQDELALLTPGLRRLYGQGRLRYKRARASNGKDTLRMHEWRKRVKDLRYVGEMLDRQTPPAGLGLTLAGGARLWQRPAATSGTSKRLRRIARRADRLGEVLGEDHDLAVLAELVANRSGGRNGAPRLGRPTRRALRKSIAKRRRSLRRKALKEGKKLYQFPTKSFVRRALATYARARAASTKA